MNFTEILMQIIFSLIVIIVGLFSGRWLCLIAPEELKQAKYWAKLLLKIFGVIIIIDIVLFYFIGLQNALFILEFILFLCAMMIGIIYFKKIKK